MTERQPTLLVIYFGASDRPQGVRVHRIVPLDVSPTGSQPTDTVHDFDSLDQARARCISEGRAQIARDPNDDPVIVESWY